MLRLSCLERLPLTQLSEHGIRSLGAGCEQLVHFRHDGEGVRDIQHVGFASRPATIRVQIDRTALVDEAPADSMRLFAVAAGGQPFRVPGRGAGLADLVQVGEA